MRVVMVRSIQQVIVAIDLSSRNGYGDGTNVTVAGDLKGVRPDGEVGQHVGSVSATHRCPYLPRLSLSGFDLRAWDYCTGRVTNHSMDLGVRNCLGENSCWTQEGQDDRNHPSHD